MKVGSLFLFVVPGKRRNGRFGSSVEDTSLRMSLSVSKGIFSVSTGCI